MNIVIPVVLVVIVGLLASVMLSYASKVFFIQQDQLFLDLRAELPGANCGGCGYAGCDDYAHAIAEGKGEIPCTKCSVGGPAVAAKLASLMGQEAGAMEKKIAFVMCNGTKDNAEALYEYEDMTSCKAAKQLFGGSKQCPYGCIGLGDCVQACEFDAIRIIDGVAVVGRDYCTSCGACAKACPQKLIKIIPESSKVQVRCHNEQKGADARKVCKTSCIGCGMCARVCPKGAITVENNLSRIDPDKCIKCGMCVVKCPTGAIQDVLHSAEQLDKIGKAVAAKEAKEAEKRKQAALEAAAAKKAAAEKDSAEKASAEKAE